MRVARYWLLFAICSVGWLIISLLIAPLTGGLDVMYFRDPGWNLISTGSFDSIGLPFAPDLTPRLFSLYTPLMPLSFAGYLSLFPRNAYAGTIYNLLLGLAGAACALYWVIRSANRTKLGKSAAIAIAVFPVAFIFYDRPEILGYPLACVTMAYAARPRANSLVAGLLISVTLLGDPIAAVCAFFWVAAFFLIRNWERPRRQAETVRQLAWAATPVVLVLAATAMVYYSIDPTSLTRFVDNATWLPSGLSLLKDSFAGRQLDVPFLGAIRTPGLPFLFKLDQFLPPIILSALFFWILVRRKQFSPAEWIIIAAGFLCIMFTLMRFPTEGIYPILLVFLIPTSFMIAGQWMQKLTAAGLALLLVTVISVNLPNYAISLLFRFEARPSYHASKDQPTYLLAHMPSPDGIVAIVPGEYDLFKPKFRHLISTLHLNGQPTAPVGAVVNCYTGFTGGPGVVRPFPKALNESEFHLIQAAPTHMWITVFGHRISDTQRGFGCDLYLRNTVAPNGGLPHS
jgi:hypothetical protein